MNYENVKLQSTNYRNRRWNNDFGLRKKSEECT